jgi:hypothetical protein
MTTRRRHWPVVAALAVLGLAGLAGCTPDEHRLPTLGGTDAPAGNPLETVAKTYYDCMVDAGLPVELTTNGTGELALVNFSGDHSILSRGADGSGMAMGGSGVPEADFQRQTEEFFADTTGEPALIVDGVDHSEAYARCLEESGYNEQEAWGTPQIDPRQIELQVKANNQWAACARDNGFPNVADTSMPEQLDGSQWPMVLLPTSITEEQVRTLVEACPNFDPEAAERMNAWWADNPTATGLPDDFLPDPAIGFDFPGWNGAYDPSWTPSPDEVTQAERLVQLSEVLFEAQTEYYQSQQGGDIGIAVPVPASEPAR